MTPTAIALSGRDLARQLENERRSAEWAVLSAALDRGALLAAMFPNEAHRFDDPTDTAAVRYWRAAQRERGAR